MTVGSAVHAVADQVGAGRHDDASRDPVGRCGESQVAGKGRGMEKWREATLPSGRVAASLRKRRVPTAKTNLNRWPEKDEAPEAV